MRCNDVKQINERMTHTMKRLNNKVKILMSASIIAIGLAATPTFADTTGQVNPTGEAAYDSYNETLETKYKTNKHSSTQKDPELIEAIENEVEAAYNKAGEIAQDVEQWGEDVFVGEMTFHKMEMASNWMGLNVVSSDGKNIGEISDVIINNSSEIDGFIVDQDIALGLGGQERFVPNKALRVNIEKNEIVISMSEQEFEQIPEFSYDPSVASVPAIDVISRDQISLANLMDTDLKNMNNETIAEVQDIRLSNGEATNVIATFDPSFMADEQALSLSFDGLTQVQTKNETYLRLSEAQTFALEATMNSSL